MKHRTPTASELRAAVQALQARTPDPAEARRVALVWARAWEDQGRPGLALAVRAEAGL